MRDEDDELLRAAEELGIDLSGVRAAADGRRPTRPRKATVDEDGELARRPTRLELDEPTSADDEPASRPTSSDDRPTPETID